MGSEAIGNGEEPELLTVKQAAKRMNVSERFVRHLMFQRRIPYTKIGANVRFVASDIDSYIEAGRVEAEAK